MAEVGKLTNQIDFGMVQSFKISVILKIAMVVSVVTTEFNTALSWGIKCVVSEFS